MRKIKLTQGKYAIVDNDDYDYLIQWKWFAHKRFGIYYAARNQRTESGRKTISMHRVINQTPDGLLTDHINKNGLDNRKSNLRNATRSQNIANSSSRKGSTSKYKGVSKHPRWTKWAARIRIDGKEVVLGYFERERDAARAYIEKAKQVFGEYNTEEVRNA